MRIKILNSALEDLYKGRLFYEEQDHGLGEYFFNSLFSDIDSLTLFAGVHIKVFGYYRKLPQKFPYAYITKLKTQQLFCGEFSTCVVILNRSVKHYVRCTLLEQLFIDGLKKIFELIPNKQ